MYINEILDVTMLENHIRNGLVTARRHPHLPLTILNYTPKAQYDRVWDKITMRCRGLIIDHNGLVVGNCMTKFFNYGEPAAQNISLKGPVDVTDKLDGSLGHICFYNNELIVATRGSFESEQAKFAYDHIMSRPDYLNAFKILCGDSVTAIVEIIYPENRIVVDYGELRDVVLIGAIANNELSNGRQLWIPADKVYSWPGPIVEKFTASSFEEALRMPPRINREGIVIHFKQTGERLKIKQEDYLIAHKFVSNLTPKHIWEQLRVGKTLEDLLDITPDEFHDTVKEYSSIIINNYNVLHHTINTEFNKIHASLPNNYSRKDFALAIAQHPLRGHLFHVLDTRQDALIESIWKTIQP